MALEAKGGLILAVQAGSVAEEAGVRAGDRLLSINGHPLRDVIDVQFYGAEERLDLWVERAGRRRRLRVWRDYGRPLGLDLAFDVDVRRCANDCSFCFVKQNPPGLRPSLSVRDDDYRLSFLSGSFVTLTNLSDDDWTRLEEQRLSPLYVSVHATDPELRRRLLGRRKVPDILEQLRRLGELGIDVHSQVVLLPGVNDGPHLARTVADLAALYGAPVKSVSIVPVGLTRFHPGDCRPYTPDESGAVLEQVEVWRQTSRGQWGCTFVYPSDEWYLVAGRDVPPADEYDGFPQLENGVGLVRQLLDEWEGAGQAFRPVEGRSATLVCGTLIAPVLGRIVGEWNARWGADLRLVVVVNGFFGPVTTVSGLLTGRDVIAALGGRDLGDLVLLPQAMFSSRAGAGDASPGITLDDLSLADLSAQLGVRVEMAGTLTEAVAALAAPSTIGDGLSECLPTGDRS